MVRKQTATSKHPMPYYMTSSPNFEKTNHYTLESLCRLSTNGWLTVQIYNQWVADGANLKKAIKYANEFRPLLLTGDKNKNILEYINILVFINC